MTNPDPEGPRWRRLARHILGTVAVATIGAALLDVPDNDRAHAQATVAPAPTAVVTVAGSPAGPSVPRGFIGFSLEFPALTAYTGADPRHPDSVFMQLIRNVDPSGGPVLRIGGDSTDATWWPVRHATRPRGISYSLSPTWMAVARSVAARLHTRLILGINLKLGQPRLSLAEARAMLQRIGRRRIAALEIGNEPGLYGRFPFYRTADGHAVRARPVGYGLTQYMHEFAALAAQLPTVPLAGPTLGAPPSPAEFHRFLAGEPAVRIATLHRYPLNRCFTSPTSPRFPTLPHLLSPFASDGLVASLGSSAPIARQAGVPLRIDELNSVACSGKRGISDTFASALWMLDELFGMAADRVAGVNIHTFPGAGYAPFGFAHDRRGWSATVRPMYYGMLAFAAAAPAGARLLPVSVHAPTNLTAWATRTGNRRMHVVLINKALSGRSTVDLRLSQSHASTATLTRLLAPSLGARAGASLGGRSFGARTYSGRPGGSSTATEIRAARRTFLVTVPPASAALVTIQLGGKASTGTSWSAAHP